MDNKFALVTGATSGLGKEFSVRLAERGYSLIIIGRRKELLSKLKEYIEDKYNVLVIERIMDLTDDEKVNSLVNEIDEKYDIEFLVNNAGHGAEDSFIEDKLENQEEMIGVHILSSVRLCHKIGNEMKKKNKGYIINVSSLASFNVFPTSAMYCATKSFLTSFTQSLAMELDKYNIRVQCLCPGFVRTDFHSKLGMNESKLRNKLIVRWMIPKDVVKISLKSLNKRLNVLVIPGFWNKVIYQCLKIIPKRLYYKLSSKGWDLL